MAVRELAPAEKHGVDDLLPVQRGRHRLAELDVVERRLARVEPHVEMARLRRVGRDNGFFLPGQLLDLRRLDPGQVDGALAQGGQARRFVLDDLDGEAVEVRQSRLEVLVVPHEAHVAARDVLGQLEGAGADGVFLKRAVLLDLFLRHHVRGAGGQHAEQRGIGLGELEPHGVGIGRLDTLHGGVHRAQHRAVLGIADALDRVADVLGRHLAAVVELDALPELEHVGSRIGNVPGGRQLALQLHLRVEAEQAAVDVLEVVGRGESHRQVGIEPHRVLVIADGQRAAALRRLSVDWPGEQGQRHEERQQGQ